MKVTLYWNDEHDIAVVAFNSGFVPTQMPSDALNEAMACFYDQNEGGANLHPFLYQVWDRDTVQLVGLMLADSMDAEDAELYAVYQQVVSENKAAPQTGKWTPKEFDA